MSGQIVKAKTSWLLQIATFTYVSNPNVNNKTSTVRILFDLGSNNSYVTRSIRAEIQDGNLRVWWVIQRLYKEFDMTALNIKSRFGGGSFPLSTLVALKIASFPLNLSVELNHHMNI